MRFRQVLGISAIGGVAVAGLLAVRRWQLRWGATGQEVGGRLPGDDIIGDPDLTATRAITIGAPAGQVWPWIVQLGQGRGGFYSYDFLENLVGCDIHSAKGIMPAWQHVGPGDQIRLAPQVALAVAMVEPGQSLVLRSGDPTGNILPPYDFTWAFVLKDAPGRDNAATCAGEICLPAAVGPSLGRACGGGQLRDEPEDAPRDQGLGRTFRSCLRKLGTGPLSPRR